MAPHRHRRETKNASVDYLSDRGRKKKKEKSQNGGRAGRATKSRGSSRGCVRQNDRMHHKNDDAQRIDEPAHPTKSRGSSRGGVRQNDRISSFCRRKKQAAIREPAAVRVAGECREPTPIAESTEFDVG